MAYLVTASVATSGHGLYGYGLGSYGLRRYGPCSYMAPRSSRDLGAGLRRVVLDRRM